MTPQHRHLLAPAALTEACKQYGKETLLYLGALEAEGTLDSADPTAMRNCLNKIKAIGEVRSAEERDCFGKL